MSHHTLHANLPLTDALERNILEDTLNEQPAVHPVATLKHAGHVVRVSINAVFNFIEVVQDTMSDAYQTRLHTPHSKI